MQNFIESWTYLATHHLTPHSIGLLACTSKQMRAAVDCHSVWERHAILALNGFYPLHERRLGGPYCSFHALSAQFIAAQLGGGGRHDRCEELLSEAMQDNDTNDPKQITRRELVESPPAGNFHFFFGHLAHISCIEAAKQQQQEEENERLAEGGAAA
jgi:hypothetical protein